MFQENITLDPRDKAEIDRKIQAIEENLKKDLQKIWTEAGLSLKLRGNELCYQAELLKLLHDQPEKIVRLYKEAADFYQKAAGAYRTADQRVVAAGLDQKACNTRLVAYQYEEANEI